MFLKLETLVMGLSCLQVYLWYPLNIVTGGTTAKIMVAAKDNFLGKYIYKDTLARNLAAVIYKVSFLLFGLCCIRLSFLFIYVLLLYFEGL